LEERKMKKMLVALMVLSLLGISAQGAAVTQTVNNGAGTSGFNAATGWSDLAAPAAGNTYDTRGFLLRTPTAAGNYTFAGDSLTVGRGAVPAGTAGYGDPFLTTGATNNNGFMNKTVTGTGVTITVNNLILDAGYIRDGMGTADAWTLAGNINVTANGGGFSNQCRLNVDSLISGSGTLYTADNGSGEVNRQTYIRNALNTYNGSVIMLGSTAVRSRLTFVDNSMMNFVVGAAGVNNKITVGAGKFGTVNFDGDFAFDLTGASATVLDSWTIASVTSQMFGSTFTVAGFTDMGDNTWRKNANGAWYEFSEATGVLAVIPEPATMLILGLGSLFLARRKR
jgi:hypothetical protein